MWRRPTLPARYQTSTIGSTGLNFRVRDENGWIPCDMVTTIAECLFDFFESHIHNYIHKQTFYYLVRTLLFSLNHCDQALDLLVSVSLMHCCTYTPDLSTLWSTRSLTILRYGISNLEVGFTLRCLQRLSTPHIAPQLCHWRDNWCTNGTTTPVLSY